MPRVLIPPHHVINKSKSGGCLTSVSNFKKINIMACNKAIFGALLLAAAIATASGAAHSAGETLCAVNSCSEMVRAYML